MNDTCDEAEDPEYNFLADDEVDIVDDEDFRNDKAVNIPSKCPLMLLLLKPSKAFSDNLYSVIFSVILFINISFEWHFLVNACY